MKANKKMKKSAGIKKKSKKTAARKHQKKKKTGVISDNKRIEQSSKAIELAYEREKKRINDSLLQMDKDRLINHITLMDKRRLIVQFKKDKLNELEKSLAKHIFRIKHQIDRLKRRKIDEKNHFDRLYVLNEHLKQVENQSKDIAVSRKTLFGKEKQLLSELKSFFKDNQKELRYHGLKKVKKIKGVVDKKTKILIETLHLINDDLGTTYKDKQIIERITDNQLNKVYMINKKLKRLAEEHRKLLIRRQELKTEEIEFMQTVDEITEKRKGLIKELRTLKE